ncbi:DUF3301 domain-containing protein [Thermomonas haemolytica]|uniref:Uncharacterized protein DUF3301 n=1 Tax=Thermomonas haemolytica TaxID=141949 RepID=A0A4R3N794_9GAMM|nr:DUF3301 domain-containing protein [Thermomonas haemolytica]TCT24387.1 uncharacterized protein DUF3301 [Thermomonas haemolytica]TNY29330.1 hypothetical protein BV505_05390 [Thermomonas haemolytica]
MPTLLVLMLVGAAGFFLFTAARAAAERAADIGRDACEAAGVQWLDQSVHATGIRLRRRDDGWLGLERSFRFEYSEDGQDRHVGRIVLLGEKLVGFSGPTRAAQAVVRAFPSG